MNDASYIMSKTMVSSSNSENKKFKKNYQSLFNQTHCNKQKLT